MMYRSIKASLTKNVPAWIFLCLFLIAESGVYEKRNDLERICNLLGDHTLWVGNPDNAKEEIDDICIDNDNEPRPDNN